MRALPLYPDGKPPLAPIDRTRARPRNPACDLCPRHAPSKTVCMAPEGAPGGLFVLGERPAVAEDPKGRPFSATAGRFVRDNVRKWWSGEVAFDHAVRCAGGTKIVTPEEVETCRGYVVSALLEVKPTRIIALGASAIVSLFGEAPPVNALRKGYGFLADGTPVFMLPSPGAVLINRFKKRAWIEDLEWALTVDLEELRADISWWFYARFVETEEDALEAEAELRQQPWVAFDCEIAGETFAEDFELCTLSMGGPDTEDPFVWERAALLDPAVSAPLCRLLADPAVPKVAHNAKEDLLWARRHFGVRVLGLEMDTMIMRQSIDAEARIGLGVAQYLVGMGGGKAEIEAESARVITYCRARETKARKIDDAYLAEVGDPVAARKVRETEEPKREVMRLIDPVLRGRYCATDVRATALLRQRDAPIFKRTEGAELVWEQITRPLLEALVEVETWGFSADRTAASAISAYVHLQQQELDSKLAPYGQFVNWGSHDQIAHVLYKELGLRPASFTEGGRGQTTADALDAIADQHPIVPLLQERSRLEGLARYAHPLVGWIRFDGRVHPSFNVAGARTGRLSCSNPPMHSIPQSKGSEEGRRLRSAFRARKGERIISVDLSQAELRVIGALSKDPAMIAVFDRGVDFHRATAAMVHRVAEEEVTAKQRSDIKPINFGLAYGQGDAGLAATIGCSVAEATRLREGVFGAYPRFAEWCEEQRFYAQREGCVWTYWEGKKARRRDLWDVADDRPGMRQKRGTALRGAVNTPIQGTTSDLCLRALGQIVAWVLRHMPNDARVTFTQHDSIVAEVREECVAAFAEALVGFMTAGEKWLGVRLVADVEVGSSWGELEPFDVSAAEEDAW